MSFEDRLKEAMTAMLRARGVKAKCVVDYEDATEYGGYCDTCYYEYAIVKITYIDSDTGTDMVWVYDGPFSELVKNLI